MFKQTILHILVLISWLPIMLYIAATLVTTHVPKTSFYISISVTDPIFQFNKWENVQVRFAKQVLRYDNSRWNWLLQNATDIQKVNNYVNQIPYEYDDIQFGVAEYWQTPFEFVNNFAGDCEDYAIAKYYLLRYIGYKPEDLRIVVVEVENQGGHAILLVREKETKKWLLLDNRYYNIMYIEDIPEKYIPFLGFNENGYFKYF